MDSPPSPALSQRFGCLSFHPNPEQNSHSSVMTQPKKSNLIGTNAAILSAGILASFILPLVAESMTDGRAGFLKAMAHVLPLLIAMYVSCMLMNSAVGKSSA